MSNRLSRRDALIRLGTTGLAVTGGLLIPLSEARADNWPSLIPGDIFVGRSQGVTQPWGTWRHAALYVGSNEVVEGGVAQSSWKSLLAGAVQKVSLPTFKNRYTNIYVFRAKSNASTKGQQMANSARYLVGRGTMNCAQLVRVCWTDAYGSDRWWLSPDYIAASSLLNWIGYKG